MQHYSLRSTVHSSTIPPSTQSSLPRNENKQITEEASKISRAAESNSASQLRGSRPPPRVPTGTNYIINVVLDLIIFWRGTNEEIRKVYRRQKGNITVKPKKKTK